MSYALLTGTLEKLEGKDEARKCAAAMASNILTKKAWVNHRRCEVEPDLDSTSLYLLVSCSKDPIQIALAKSWVTRTIANSDGGLATLGLERFSFRPGAVSLPTMKAAFKQLKLDVAYRRERLNHWKQYCEEIGEPCRGLNQRMLAAKLCYRLTQEGAWEKCVTKPSTLNPVPLPEIPAP